MKKKSISSSLLILVIFILLIIIFNRKKITSSIPLSDTVEASKFIPIKTKNHININLKNITSLDFPKYSITKENVFIPDTLSLAEDEENIASGNYTAILTLDTILNKKFIAQLQKNALKDTCWKIKDAYISYIHKDKKGGKYNISFSTKGRQITVTHIE